MSEPINSVELTPIHIPESGPSVDLPSNTRERSAAGFDRRTTGGAGRENDGAVLKRLNAVQARFEEAGSNVSVGVDHVNGQTVFTIKDVETGKVIRKIPSDEAIRISQNLDRLTGLYVDKME